MEKITQPKIRKAQLVHSLAELKQILKPVLEQRVKDQQWKPEEFDMHYERFKQVQQIINQMDPLQLNQLLNTLQ